MTAPKPIWRKLPKPSLSVPQTIIILSIFWATLSNYAMFRSAAIDYPFQGMNIVYFCTNWLLLVAFHVLLLSLLCFRPWLKWTLIPLLLTSSIAAYFMDTFNIVIDESMLLNILQTNSREALDLFSFKLVLYVVFMGLAPALLLLHTQLKKQPVLIALRSRGLLLIGSFVLIIGIVFSFNSFYASFFREHKHIRYYANPTAYLFACIKFTSRNAPKGPPTPVKPIGEDAQIVEEVEKPELLIFVVGETVRADRFSLNGYEKETNPLLATDQAVSFTNFLSCGTATAISVPCMFSLFGEDDFSLSKARSNENVLDLLQNTGVKTLWIDNNSDSKGVADRVPYISHRNSETVASDGGEPRDVDMLQKARAFIEDNPNQDILILLHQMGSHGPAYYKRYPPQFEVFQPVCKTNQLNECSQEEIDNAYDNTIVYTDFFLHQTIALLREYQQSYETIMLYVGDHGESLGEGGLYLHGMPKLLAPKEQIHVPAIIWADEDNDDVDLNGLAAIRDQEMNHDFIFHSLLSFFEVQSREYDPNLDFLERSRLVNAP